MTPSPDTIQGGAARPRDRHALLAAMAAFQAPSLRRSLTQFGVTFGAFVAVNAAMYATIGVSVWLALTLTVPAACLLVRLFIIQHDCGHGSYFRSRRLNDLLGQFCSAITFTPYAFWRRQHAVHHAGFNNLDRREPSTVDLYSTCATVAEYQALPRARRLWYRITHHPVVAQVLVPPFVFLLVYRVPFEAPKSWRRERASVHLTNLTVACVIGGLIWAFGLWPVVLVQVPIIAITSIIGVWLFTVQHRFEYAQWMRQDRWSHARAALEGSSYLKLPRVLQWLTGNIGFHHVHHLTARVPNYRLQECHDASPDLATETMTLSLWDALLAPCYALWDEERSRMVRFPRRAPRLSPA